eukprot:80748-Amphidinium_carterae.1
MQRTSLAMAGATVALLADALRMRYAGYNPHNLLPPALLNVRASQDAVHINISTSAMPHDNLKQDSEALSGELGDLWVGKCAGTTCHC